MKHWQGMNRARDQVHHYKVKMRQMHSEFPPSRQTDQFIQLLEMVESLVDAVCSASINNQVVSMQLDIYDVLRLPGFDGPFDQMKSPDSEDLD